MYKKNIFKQGAQMKPRGRPKKQRILTSSPKINQFSPRGKPGRPDETNLNADEFEAIRLADFFGMSQKEAAKSMKISQQTFSRIIKKAHKVIAEAIVKGNIIRIQEYNYVINSYLDSYEGGDSIEKRNRGLV